MHSVYCINIVNILSNLPKACRSSYQEFSFSSSPAKNISPLPLFLLLKGENYQINNVFSTRPKTDIFICHCCCTALLKLTTTC